MGYTRPFGSPNANRIEGSDANVSQSRVHNMLFK